MAVKIRLKRMGKIRAPFYRIVVVDSRKKRDGAVIEEIGKYHPTEEPSFMEVASERAQYWLGVGAQPSEQVTAILKRTGDWQTFTGEGGEGDLRTAEPRTSAEDLITQADEAATASRGKTEKPQATATEVEPGSEEAPAEGESTADAEAARIDEA